MAEKEQYIIYRIPHNFESQINIMGFPFKLRNLIEGAFVGLLCGGIIAGILYIFNVYSAIIVGFSLCGAATGLLVGSLGIDGDPITVYIKHRIDFRRNSRIAYYNPRIKYEAVSIWNKAQNKGTTPLEKMMSIYKKWTDTNTKKSQQQAIETYRNSQNNLPEVMIFEDDLGYVDNIPEIYAVKKGRINEKD